MSEKKQKIYLTNQQKFAHLVQHQDGKTKIVMENEEVLPIEITYKPKGVHHVGIIMDGNSRWAKKNDRFQFEGHKKGLDIAIQCIHWAIDLNIEHLSLYAFSFENWNRPEKEVNYLLQLLDDFIEEKLTTFLEYQCRVQFVGDLRKLPKDLYGKIQAIHDFPMNDPVLTIYILFSYGGKTEILDAINTLLLEGRTKITEKEWENYLYAPGMPNVDMVIRTGGDL
jgi:undecaprenyl diphosphate synthase